MTRIMGDSTTLADIPLTVDIAAVYDDGHIGVATAAELEARFPHARYGHVFIDVTGAQPGSDVRDWETGDKAGSLEQWVIDHNRITGRKDAVVYCNRATIAEVRQLTGSQILGEDYWLFIATLDGTEFGPQQLHGVVACQRDGEAQTGGHWDRSIVYADWLWLPAAPPALTTEVDVTRLPVLRKGSSGQAVRNWQALLVAHGYGYLLGGAATGNVMQQAGVDGQFGARTDEATRRFQADRHLPATGAVDAATWAAALGG